MDIFNFRLKNSKIWHTSFCILLFCLLIFLSIRASDEYRWSDWGIGDAQVMLSVRHWEEEGWLANRLLLIPTGYAKVIRLLDEPELRHHAQGISPISSPRVGPRLRYTHYPSGYLIPYALLFKLGFERIFFMRLLSIFFSIGALILIYVLFSKITSPRISFVAVFFYVLSSTFLGYADCIGTQPIDDLLRFAFMLGIVLSTRAASLRQRRIWMVSAWIIEFLLSLVSFDSVFFVYLWLISWDFLDRQGFRWKTYLIFALAPLTAHSLQFLQNVWYLGLTDAVIDIKDTFFMRSGLEESFSRFFLTGYSFIILFNNFYKPIGLIVLLLIFYTVYSKFLRDKNERELPSMRLLAVLLFCGLAFGFLLPYGTTMSYEAKQIAPFMILLVSGTTWSFLKEFRRSIRRNYNFKRKKEFSARQKLMPLYLFFCTVIFIAFWYHFAIAPRKPLYDVKGHPDALLARKIKSIPTKYDPVFFNMGGFQKFLGSVYFSDYPQINPIIEYYVGSKPILCFAKPEGLASDLIYMVNRSPYKFSPILVTENLAYIKIVLSGLSKKEVLEKEPPQPDNIMGKYILDLTDYLKWDET